MADFDANRTPEYIQMYFASIPKCLAAPSNLRYTIGVPLQRQDYPEEVLKSALPVSYDRISDSKSFEIEREILSNSSGPDKILAANVDMIKYSLKEVFSTPRNAFVDSLSNDIAASFIYEKMARYGLVTSTQDFLQQRSFKNFSETSWADLKSPWVNGTNIFGIFPGKFWNTRMDRPLIIGKAMLRKCCKGHAGF